MLTELFVSNLARTTVVYGGMDAPVPETEQTLTVKEAAGIFPVVHRGVEQFHFVDRDPDSASEVFRCIATDNNSWTVIRGADGTTPVTHRMKFSIRQIVPSGFFQRLGSGSTTEIVNAVTVFGADPTGKVPSETAILQSLDSGPTYLPSGIYRIQHPINLLPGSVLLSFGDAIIRPDRDFAGDAAVEILDGNGLTRLEHITLDGAELGGGTDIYGLFAETRHLEAELRSVRISGFSNSGAIVSGVGWQFDRITAIRNHGSGFELNLDASLMLGCRALGNSRYGFTGAYQDQLIGCSARDNRLGDFR